uniref:Cyclin-like domain-containing protein n=1 Tax=Leersia perrieri TaxID=77586 RepID=A0A0D9XBC8_9ORYZ
MAFATLFDSLYCPEEHLDLFHDPAGDEAWPEQEQQQPAAAAAPLLDDELPALFEALRGKEKAAGDEDDGDGYGGVSGREAAVGWALRAVARLGFSALTAALAVAYLDRCFLAGGALRLGGEHPWMPRLAAVACVSLAAKVEETRVPMLLDLQLCAADNGDADEAYVFEAKTVRRMELLVLSALQWRMHPVTPLSFLHPLLLHAARLRHCENALLAVMADCRWPRHRPSAWAAAALLATANSWCHDGDLLALIDAPNDEVAECAKILSEEAAAGGIDINKRKRATGLYSPPASPSGVIGASACFSCESSSSSFDSRLAASSPDTPGRRPLKRAIAASTTMDAAHLLADEDCCDAYAG